MIAFLLSGVVLGGWILLWAVVGQPWKTTGGGVLWTGRALMIGSAFAVIGALGYWASWALDAMLVANVLMIAVIWMDATLAPPVAAAPSDARVTVTREPPAALSVGHASEVSYRWANHGQRTGRLIVREIRPAILGGPQPSRELRLVAGKTTIESVVVMPQRRGREASGSFFVDSFGPLGLGRRRMRFELPWEVVVYPPLVSVRLRASVAEALRRREAGMKPIRQLGEGRLFESLREWGPGDDLRHIDWKATARRGKVITRQYEA